MLLNNSRKIAYTAILSALGVALILIAAYLPLSFAPFLAASLILFYLFEKCGLIYGLLSAIVVSLLSILILGGAGIYQAVPYMVMFAPYSLAAFFLNKLKISNKVIGYMIRYSILLVLFNVSLFTVFKLAGTVLFDMAQFAKIIGGYFVFALIMSAIFILFDQVFIYLYKMLIKSKIFK